MEFTVEIEIWRLKLSFETLATGTVMKSWLGQEKRRIIGEYIVTLLESVGHLRRVWETVNVVFRCQPCT